MTAKQDRYSTDAWSFLDFKGKMARDQKLSPTWVDSHWRRLQAYIVLESYFKNVSRMWMGEDISDGARNNKREYGDAHLIVESFLASLVGDEFYPFVAGSEGKDADPKAVAAQEVMTEWFNKERGKQKVIEQERQTLKLGDGVWVMGWSKSKKRPTLRVYDPGHFYPVWRDDHLDDEFPDKVHIAYEFESEDALGKMRTYVRRITYELSSYKENEDGSADSLSVPWREEPVDVTCFMSDGTWVVNQDTKKIDDFDEDKAEWRVRDLDLEIDFIPVIHSPNTVAGNEFWGTSVIAMILQVFDDIVNNDTDLQIASANTASPVIAVSGGGGLPKDADGRVVTYGPGTVFDIEDGDLSVLDMSKGLDALLKYSGYLLERISINGRVPESLMGRVKPSEVPSGVALWLSFSSHSSAIAQMRLVRHDNYGLVMKFAQRFMLKEGQIEQVWPCTMKFGSFLPADRKEALDMVVQAMNAKRRPMSRGLAVKVLMEAGFPIDEAHAEVAKIEAEDYESAGEYLDATADLDGARKLLGLPPLAEADIDNDTGDPEADPLS